MASAGSRPGTKVAIIAQLGVPLVNIVWPFFFYCLYGIETTSRFPLWNGVGFLVFGKVSFVAHLKIIVSFSGALLLQSRESSSVCFFASVLRGKACPPPLFRALSESKQPKFRKTTQYLAVAAIQAVSSRRPAASKLQSLLRGVQCGLPEAHRRLLPTIRHPRRRLAVAER